MEKAYLVKSENGEQIGPFDEEALQRLAQEGSIPENAMIRSTMLNIWAKAKDTDCLKKIFRARMLARAEEFANDPKAQLRARLEMRGDYDPLANALNQEGITYQKAGFISRFLAGIFDLGILAFGAIVLLLVFWILGGKTGVLSPVAALHLYIGVVWCLAAAYYMYYLDVKGQTPGQRFWGLVVITPDHGSVYPIKGFLFFLLTLFFGILSPITWLIFGGQGTLQEYVPRVQVRHVTVTRRY